MTTPGADLFERAARLAPIVLDRLGDVRRRIEEAGGDPDRVRVVAVTKTFGPEACLAALEAGIEDVGENYATELLEKAAALSSSGRRPRWHFIGRIQRNKIARLAPVVSCWQSVSRPGEVEAILAHSPGRSPEVFVEVNLSGEETRGGCDPRDVARLVALAREKGLEVRGLMAVAPLGVPGRTTERLFREVGEKGAALGLAELSLGMSGDLEQAVRCGSTMVRIGTALFGARDSHAKG